MCELVVRVTLEATDGEIKVNKICAHGLSAIGLEDYEI